MNNAPAHLKYWKNDDDNLQIYFVRPYTALLFGSIHYLKVGSVWVINVTSALVRTVIMNNEPPARMRQSS